MRKTFSLIVALLYIIILPVLALAAETEGTALYIDTEYSIGGQTYGGGVYSRCK